MDDRIGRDDGGDDIQNAPAATAPPSLPPMPEPPPAPDPGADQATLLQYQAEMQRYQMLIETYSNILKSMADMSNETIKNTRA